jgi:hypothetical protein
MSFFFTTIWGALYLGVLLVTMVPALWFRRLRVMAATMIFLAFVDRMSVTFLPPDVALAFLSVCYFALAVFLTFVPPVTVRNLGVAFCLSATAAALIAGSFEWLNWDITGTIQESFGAIAMATIIWPGRHGDRVSDENGEVAHSRGELGAVAGTLASRQADESAKKSHSGS